MKNVKNRCLLFLLLFAASSASASELDFNFSTIPTDDQPVYGNRIANAGNVTVSGTDNDGSTQETRTAIYAAPGAEDAASNIVIKWGSSGGTKKYYGSGYGDLPGVAYAGVRASAIGYLMGYIPDAGYQAKVHSLMVVRWGDGGDTNNYVRIRLEKTSGWTQVYDSGQVYIRRQEHEEHEEDQGCLTDNINGRLLNGAPNRQVTPLWGAL